MSKPTPRFLATLLLLPAMLIAQDEQKSADDEPIPHEKIRVKVVDPDGDPVEGATVSPSGLRSRVERGSHWGWSTERHGPVPKAVTNAEGMVELAYPKFIHEKLATGEVTWSVDHDDFVLFREDRSVDDDPAELQLKRGYRIATTATNVHTGESIKSDLYASVSGDWGSKWKLRSGGVLTSRVFDRTQASLRVIHLPKEGPTLFSDLQTVSPEKGRNRVFLRDVKLKRGTVVHGKLDPVVPRPVENGRVIATIVVPGLPDPDSDSWDGTAPGWHWIASTTVEPDGSFHFESLPTGDVVQLIAVCDGWVSKLPNGAELKKQFPQLVERDNFSPGMRWPQLFRLDGKQITPTISMEKTGNCQVTVHDPEGKPLEGARVVMWPNQIFFKYGSQILGDAVGSKKILRMVRDGQDLMKAFRNRKTSYDTLTNEKGVALIKNLPAPAESGVAVMHKEFEQAVQDRGRRQTTAQVKQGETTAITVKMQPKGTETVGAGE